MEDKFAILNKAFEERQDHDTVIISNKSKETHLRKDKKQSNLKKALKMNV